MHKPLQYEPGTNWSYVHADYVLLGLALEKATGRLMADLLDEKVILPLGLTGTRASLTTEIPEPALHGFTSERLAGAPNIRRPRFFEESTYWNPSWASTHGAVQTATIADLEATAVGIGPASCSPRTPTAGWCRPTPHRRCSPGSRPNSLRTTPRRCRGDNDRVTSRVLFLYNDPVATEALLGDAFVDAGYDVDTFTVVPPERAADPAVDVVFPDPTGYDVIVPLGARWPVYDDALRRTWVGVEMAMLREAAEAGVALLGVCFGGQILAQAFGGTVGRAPAPEIGWYDITTDRPDLMSTGPWFQWHFDRWTAPPGAVEIVRTTGASQAFLLDRCLALQFHPELDHGLLTDWLADDRAGQALAFGLDHDELLRCTREFEADAAIRIRGLVDAFLTYVAGVPCPS